MFRETKKTNGPISGLLAIKVEAAKRKIAALPRKAEKKAKPNRA